MSLEAVASVGAPRAIFRAIFRFVSLAGRGGSVAAHREGEVANEMYFLHRGRVQISCFCNDSTADVISETIGGWPRPVPVAHVEAEIGEALASPQPLQPSCISSIAAQATGTTQSSISVSSLRSSSSQSEVSSPSRSNSPSCSGGVNREAGVAASRGGSRMGSIFTRSSFSSSPCGHRPLADVGGQTSDWAGRGASRGTPLKRRRSNSSLFGQEGQDVVLDVQARAHRAKHEDAGLHF